MYKCLQHLLDLTAPLLVTPSYYCLAFMIPDSFLKCVCCSNRCKANAGDRYMLIFTIVRFCDCVCVCVFVCMQIRVMHVDATFAQGPVWARHHAQRMWSGESYFMQIDSHMRSVYGDSVTVNGHGDVYCPCCGA